MGFHQPDISASMKNYLFLWYLLLPLATTTVAAQDLFKVGESTINYLDSSRQRPLKTEIWYPTAEDYKPADLQNNLPFILPPTIRDARVMRQTFPLVLISHGTGGGRLTLSWLAISLAQQGYIVAAVDHWGNTYDNKIPVNFLKFWDRPLDISFVLTQLLQDTTFNKVIDPQNIGAAGFSIGGYTVLALAGGEVDDEALRRYNLTPQGRKETEVPELPQLADMVNDPAYDSLFLHVPPLQDQRIKAVFAMAPALGQGFQEAAQVKKIQIPVFLVDGESDSIAPVKTNAAHYHQLIPQSEYKLLKGKVGHYVFLNEAIEPVKKEAPMIFEDDPSVDRHLIHEQVCRMADKFFSKSLKKH